MGKKKKKKKKKNYKYKLTKTPQHKPRPKEEEKKGDRKKRKIEELTQKEKRRRDYCLTKIKEISGIIPWEWKNGKGSKKNYSIEKILAKCSKITKDLEKSKPPCNLNEELAVKLHKEYLLVIRKTRKEIFEHPDFLKKECETKRIAQELEKHLVKINEYYKHLLEIWKKANETENKKEARIKKDTLVENMTFSFVLLIYFKYFHNIYFIEKSIKYHREAEEVRLCMKKTKHNKNVIDEFDAEEGPEKFFKNFQQKYYGEELNRFLSNIAFRSGAENEKRSIEFTKEEIKGLIPKQKNKKDLFLQTLRDKLENLKKEKSEESVRKAYIFYSAIYEITRKEEDLKKADASKERLRSFGKKKNEFQVPAKPKPSARLTERKRDNKTPPIISEQKELSEQKTKKPKGGQSR